MTVESTPPIARYTGNGVVTKFDWNWQMGPDSVNEVLVDNELVDDYTEQGQSMIFDPAPADGIEVIIYRRTLVYMPENYVAFGRFAPNKTELSMDRATMVAQERLGDAEFNEPPNGIVGGTNLYLSRQEYTQTVISERGSDAVVPMWLPDDIIDPDPTPDAAIIWAGDEIYGLIVENTPQFSIITFRMDLTEGDPTEASAQWENSRQLLYAGWLNTAPGNYWMRVISVVSNPTLVISDGNSFRSLNEEFPMTVSATSPPRGPYVSVSTYGFTAPSTQLARVRIDICKDDNGAPDGAWISRLVTLEARLYG